MKECRLAAHDLACLRGERLLFRHLSLSLFPGEALHLAGPNGIGKSSLIRILAGLRRPYAGDVQRDGAIGLLDEHPALDEHLPLAKALRFWEHLDGSTAAGWDSLGLERLRDVPVRYLSTGQRKRAALARLAGQQAPIWLLDEPLNGLDSDAVAHCERMVAEHCAAGGIAVIASHQPFTMAGLTRLMLAEHAL
ncbi:heme ABC exporter ATP-binding protein CcmA [Altericroceibacterium spongiae]|uniref:Heme ABC exporter ATP-binding protein CcmA n=1 Tax=Altericroceibacterium spongiae TaxID=2320269 RepID=A0A420EKI7_9SPHN|nr:heme ABC exporter ATP-binding protein CcmA [Altericroceibacterium spongiae]RKF21193.1 heme ABC exporter ATP-binding protein CcmA [Altericroceibacterium spongiae]